MDYTCKKKKTEMLLPGGLGARKGVDRAEESGTILQIRRNSLALFTSTKCPNGEAKSRARVATSHMLEDAKQGRQVLQHTSVDSPGADVTGSSRSVSQAGGGDSPLH
jgi:hypothetical protein